MRTVLSFIVATVVAFPAAIAAQAARYPALQPTQIAVREYNFALADFAGGTALVAQWREGLNNSGFQLTADVGLADDRNNAGLLVGGSLHYQLTRAAEGTPFDMVVGGGLGFTGLERGSRFRLPVGVAIGRRFLLDGDYAISPFVHPRLSIDRVATDAGAGVSVRRTETNLDIDIGASLEINNQMQLRLAAMLGDRSAVGISFAWLPQGLRK
jgi:hypothetical protein